MPPPFRRFTPGLLDAGAAQELNELAQAVTQLLSLTATPPLRLVKSPGGFNLRDEGEETVAAEQTSEVANADGTFNFVTLRWDDTTQAWIEEAIVKAVLAKALLARQTTASNGVPIYAAF